MNTFTAIIADDEVLAIKRIENLLKGYENIQVLATYTDGHEAIKGINQLHPALLFLDINFPDITGFEIINSIDYHPIVVFITAHDRYAIEAFEVFAFDFLVKPFKDERFQKTIQKILANQSLASEMEMKTKMQNLLEYMDNLKQAEEGKDATNKLAIKLAKKISFINTVEIKYICASGYHSEIFTHSKKYVLRESISKLHIQLNNRKFTRVHRSTLINIDYVDELLYSSFGEVDVKMTDGKLLRVSKGYKKEFLKWLGV
jgi:two-component system LytT family response regulator